MKMAFFRCHDAHIALCQTDEAGITITLVETFPDLTSAVNAFNLLQIFNLYRFAETVIEPQFMTAEFELINHYFFVVAIHLVQVAPILHD